MKIQALKQPHLFSWSVFIVSAAGIITRLALLLYNRSLWLDEACLAMNVLERTFARLFEPLDYNQGAPVGFLLASKVMVNLFGPGEMVLRVIPFASGVLLIGFFWLLARQTLGRKYALAAQFLISFSPALIYYSTEFKQYASDALICVFLLLLGLHYIGADEKSWAAVWLGLAGTAAMWFSHPALFVLAGIGIVLGIDALRRKDWKALAGLSVIGLAWLASFAALYKFSLRPLSYNQVLTDYWMSYFAPLPRSLQDIVWYADAFTNMFVQPGGIPFGGLAFFCFTLGSIALYRQRKIAFFLLLSPFPFLLAASGLHLYPFGNRLLIFLLPVLILLAVRGIESIRQSFGKDSLLAAALLVGLIGFYPAYQVYKDVRSPAREEIRPVLQYIRQNWQEGDVIYVYYASELPFKYYAQMFKISSDQYVKGRSTQDWEEIRLDLEQYQGKQRIWFLYSHPRGDDLKVHQYMLKQMGEEIQSFRAAGALTFLYDLSQAHE